MSKSTTSGERRAEVIQHLGLPGPGRHGPGGPGRFAEAVKADKPMVTVRRILGYLKGHMKSITVVCCIVVLGTGLQMLVPYLQGWAIDKAIEPGNLTLLSRAVWMMGATALLFGGLTLSQQWIMIGISQRMVRNLRKSLYDRMMELSIRFFDTHSHGDLMSRITNDIDTISMVLTSAVPNLLSSSLLIAGIAVAMLIINWKLALIALMVVPAVSLVTRTVAKRTRAGFKAQQRNLGILNGIIEENVSGIRILKLFRREREALDHFQTTNTALRKASIRAQILAGLMGPVMNMMRNINFAIVAFAGGLFAVNGLATIGTIAIFLQYTRQFSRPINEIAMLYNTIQSAIAGAERVFAVMDEEPDVAEVAGAEPLRVTHGSVALNDVSFGYTQDRPVLRNIGFRVSPGMTVALVGPTGAGKTTVVNLLTRFYDIDHGSIHIDDIDITRVTIESLRRSIGIVLQDTFLFGDTVRENIRYGRLAASDAEVERAAQLAHADHFIRHLSRGYETVLSEEGSNLSQGQRQLISIARAILADPAVLVLDEATSSVDTRTEVHIQEAMKTLMKGRTSFVIAHRLNTIRDADIIMVMNNGEIVESGSHDELIELNGAYAGLYQSQLRIANS